MPHLRRIASPNVKRKLKLDFTRTATIAAMAGRYGLDPPGRRCNPFRLAFGAADLSMRAKSSGSPVM
jgi:hypothetical protein